jgi:hypothetical protein
VSGKHHSPAALSSKKRAAGNVLCRSWVQLRNKIISNAYATTYVQSLAPIGEQSVLTVLLGGDVHNHNVLAIFLN